MNQVAAEHSSLAVRGHMVTSAQGKGRTGQLQGGEEGIWHSRQHAQTRGCLV